jgi:hypothetical protein
MFIDTRHQQESFLLFFSGAAMHSLAPQSRSDTLHLVSACRAAEKQKKSMCQHLFGYKHGTPNGV